MVNRRILRSILLMCLGLNFIFIFVSIHVSFAQSGCNSNALFTQVSKGLSGVQGNGDSWGASLSVDGRYVAFISTSSNLVPNDTNNRADIFVYDSATCLTKRVSVASDGTQGNDASGDHTESPFYPSNAPAISADGRYVAFSSLASNLVANDTNQALDTFVHDMFTGVTERVSIASNGQEGKGEIIVGEQDNRDYPPGDDLLALVPPVGRPAISPDGRYVAFSSGLIGLVDKYSRTCKPNNEINYPYICPQIYRHDRATGQTILVSVDGVGNPGADGASSSPAISADGQVIAFESHAKNLQTPAMPDCTYRGSLMTMGCGAMYIWDSTSKFSHYLMRSDTESRTPYNKPTISADGTIVEFSSPYTANSDQVYSWQCSHDPDSFEEMRECNQVFRYDRTNATFTFVTPITETSHDSYHHPSISADARFTVFYTEEGHRPPEGGALYYTYGLVLLDHATNVRTRLADLIIGNSGSFYPQTLYEPFLSADGTRVAFTEYKAYVPEDTNNRLDVYLIRLDRLSATATPTVRPTVVVPTNTPAVTHTPMPTTQPGKLKIQYMAGNTTAQTNQLKPYFKIVNLSGVSVPLSELKIRYWYTRENAQPQIVYCDYASFGCANLTKRYVPLSVPRTNANFYVELGFTTTAGNLSPNTSTGAILTRIINKDWSLYTQPNDYSFDATRTTYADFNHITLYRNGVLLWGVEPPR